MTTELIRRPGALRIFACTASLEPGGAQRAMTQLCNWLVQRGHDVTLATLDPQDYQSFYPLAHEVEWRRLSGRGRIGRSRVMAAIERLRILRREVRASRPDLVLSFIDTFNVSVILATRGLGIPVIVSERTDPARHDIGAWKSLLRRLAYRRADRVVVQTEMAARYFASGFRTRVEIVPGAIAAPDPIAHPDQAGPDGRYRIVSVGRLERSKAIDLLIAAFASLADRFPEWDLVVYGDGPERGALDARIAGLDLGARISLPGWTRDIPGELAASHLFAFPSRYEGFSNALGEAAAAGLPAVAFRPVSGNEELVGHGETGYLVDRLDDLVGFAQAMAELMGDTGLRARFGNGARERARRWAPDAVHRRWEMLLRETAGTRPMMSAADRASR